MVGVELAAAEETLDELLRGRIRLYQPRRGARVSLDALLLADFAGRGNYRRVLDLGCGGGVVGLVLAVAAPAAQVVGVEIQGDLAALARRNAALNGVDGRCEIREGDVARAGELGLAAGSFDLVVSNPPFHRHAPAAHQRSGRDAPAVSRALSRHELAAGLGEFVAAARRFVRPRGRVALVFPAERMPELIAGLHGAELHVRSLRPVCSAAGEPARRVLVEAVRGYRGGARIESPLVIHGPDRRSYTEEAARILGERPPAMVEPASRR